MAELTASQEAAVQRGVQAAYGQWLPQVEGAVLGGYTRYGVAPDPAATATTAGDWRVQVRQLETQQLQPVATAQYDQEDPEGEIDFTSILMAAAAAATLYFLMSQVGEVTSALTGIVTSTPNRAEAVARIKAYLDPLASHWRSKSAQLAVSEGNRWAQAASLTAAVAVATRTRQPMSKIWMTQGDMDVRHAHATTAGQRRALLAAFNVGGFPMMHPMDPAAPPSLVVNCRCWMRFDRGIRG